MTPITDNNGQNRWKNGAELKRKNNDQIKVHRQFGANVPNHFQEQ